MKTILRCALWGITFCTVCSTSAASQPIAPASEKSTTYEELASLGESVSGLDRLMENVFAYEEQIAASRQVAESLASAAVQFSVKVQRVTHHQVFVTVPDAGKTRIALRHATLPEYGNLRTVEYCGPPSVQVSRHFARRVSLRIGSEIPMEMAQRLRHGDRIAITGKVESVQVFAETTFCSAAVAIISDWEVVAVVSSTIPAY
ncbi:MAG: hypothetical protein ACC628_18715 [Pirellulaceae bacterium]